MIEVLITFLIYSIGGTILHFTYKLSGKSVIVGIFSSVNESVWEHIKILLTMIFTYNTIRYIFNNSNNYFLMLFIELLSAIIFIILFYKIKVALFKDKYDFINIICFYVVSFMCSYFGFLIKNMKTMYFLNTLSIFGVIIIFIMYMTFSVCPPKNELFQDPITKKYGIEV